MHACIYLLDPSPLLGHTAFTWKRSDVMRCRYLLQEKVWQCCTDANMLKKEPVAVGGFLVLIPVFLFLELRESRWVLNQKELVIGITAPVNFGRRRRCAADPNKSAVGEAVRRGWWSSLISHSCFKSFPAKNFCYQGLHVELLFLQLSGLKFEKML